MPRGGKRPGAGRKKNSDPTVTIRVPLSMKQDVRRLIHAQNPASSSDKSMYGRLETAIDLLEQALSLKANAGGKIKTEIRKAMDHLTRLNQTFQI